MNPDICAVSSCYLLRDRLSQYCRPHLTRFRRSGHPTKRVILKQELRSFQKLVRRLARSPDLQPHWLNAVASMKAILRPSGEPRKRYRRVRTRGVRGRPPASSQGDYVSLRWTQEGVLRRELQRLQTAYRPSSGSHGGKHGGRLRSVGGLPEEAVEFATAAFLFAHTHPRLLNDGPHLTHQIGSILLRLAPLRSYRAGVPNKPPVPRWPAKRFRTQSIPPPTLACRILGERVRERLTEWFTVVRQAAHACYSPPSDPATQHPSITQTE